jgi:hypothetical protein
VSRPYTLVPGLLLAMAGCNSMAVADDVPARIPVPTAASRAALQAAVNDALRTDVLLAADAFTDSSVLTVERNVPRSIDGQSAQGRNMELPLRFRLVKSGDACVLIDERDGSRHVLADTDCIAE